MRDYIAGNSYIDFLQAEGMELVSINDGPAIHMIHTLGMLGVPQLRISLDAALIIEQGKTKRAN